MSSEQLADGVNPLDAELAATWDVLKGYSGRDTDLGIARRFGDAAAAYSLRNIGSDGLPVVKVRRDVDGQGSDPEEDFSAHQVQGDILEDWVNGKLEGTLPADVATAAAAYSLRKVKASYSGNAVRIRRSSDNIEVDVAFDSDGKVSASSAITNVAEQGGESGQTTDTTLGDFISGTDAFVHTWYDQAGSNDAVQATAANQPKIAESGALLTDGLLFDGSNDSFEATDITDVNFPATVVSVSETNKIGSPNTALYSLNNDSNACCGFYRSTSKYAINNGTTTLEGSATYTTGVHRLKFDLFNGASSAGFSNAVSDISGDIGTQVSQVTHFRIAGSLKAGITNPHNGTIKEIILYTSDQSDNRFKIESNINNYYGLYNDANEFASDETAFRFLNERSGGISASSDLTQFTLDVQTSSGYAGAKLSSDVLSGDAIYVSFNCSFDNGSPSPKIALRDIDSTLAGTVRSNEENVNEGFNSFTLTSTDSNASGIVWSEGDDNVIFSVTDLKVSRIARNGFVETWYDQSGSGNNATQTTAGQQPKIVENGGIVKNVKGFPSVKFESANSTELDIGLLISNLNSVSAYVVTQKDSGDTNRIAGFTQGVSTDNSRFYFPFYTGGTTPNLGYNDSASKISFGTTLTGTCNLYSAFSGDTNIEAFKNGSSVGTTALVDQAVTATDSKIGQLSNSFRFDGVMSEIFLTTQKLQDDAATINSNVTSYYNL